MKKFVLTMLIVLYCNPMVYAAGTEYQLGVDGVACPFCVYGIEKQLDKIGGIVGMESDIGSGVIHLTVDESVTVTEEKVRQAVEKAGFSLRAFGVSDTQ